MPISHINKCVFVHIPRTGGTSFRKMLKIDEEKSSDLEKFNSKGLIAVSNNQEGKPSHDTPRVFQKEHLLMSQMAQFKVVDRDIFNHYFKFDVEDLFYEEYSKLTFNILWNKKLDNILMPWGGNEVHSDPHFFPQHLFTHDLNGTLLVDFIGRFETYEEDAQNILEHMGNQNPIEKLHSSDHPPYCQAYTPITRDIIANVFQTDIKVFGYQF